MSELKRWNRKPRPLSPGRRRKRDKRQLLLMARRAERAGMNVLDYAMKMIFGDPIIANLVPFPDIWNLEWRDRSPARAKRRAHLQPAIGRRQRWEAKVSASKDAFTSNHYESSTGGIWSGISGRFE